MNNVQIFRPLSGYFYTGATLLLAAGLVVSVWLTDDWTQAIGATLWGLVFTLGSYLVFLHPKIEIFDEGVTVTNPFLAVTLGWNQIENIDVHFALTFETGSKKIVSWAALAPGRYHGRSVHPSELKGYRLSNSTQIRPGESPRTTSGEAAQLCRLRLAKFRETSLIGAKPAVKFNTLGVVSLVVALMAATAFSFLH